MATVLAVAPTQRTAPAPVAVAETASLADPEPLPAAGPEPGGLMPAEPVAAAAQPSGAPAARPAPRPDGALPARIVGGSTRSVGAPGGAVVQSAPARTATTIARPEATIGSTARISSAPEVEPDEFDERSTVEPVRD